MLTASYQCVWRFFHSTCLKYCACHEKVRPGHTKCCTCHAKSSQKTWRSDAPKCNPLSGNQRPDLLTALMKMSLVLRLPRKMHLCRSSSNVPRLPSFLEMLQKPSRFAHSWQGAQSLAPATRNDGLNLQKWSEPLVFLTFWLRNVLRATTACTFFDISTSKKWSRTLVFLSFWLRNVLRTTTACTFSTSQLPKVVRSWCVLCIFTWKGALRHNGVQFFISHLAQMAPHAAALASLLFDPPEPQIIGKTQCFATFLPFRASASSFFWLFFFSDLLSSTLLFSLTLPISAFHLSILSEVWLLNFLRLLHMLRKKQYIDILWGNTLVGISMSDHESSSAGLETYRLRGGTTLGLLSNTNSNLLKSSTSTSHFEYFELGTWCPWSSDHHLSPYLCNSNLKEDLSQTAVIDGTQRHLCRRQVDENLHHGQTLRFLPCAHGCNTSPPGTLEASVTGPDLKSQSSICFLGAKSWLGLNSSLGIIGA